MQHYNGRASPLGRSLGVAMFRLLGRLLVLALFAALLPVPRADAATAPAVGASDPDGYKAAVVALFADPAIKEALRDDAFSPVKVSGDLGRIATEPMPWNARLAAVVDWASEPWLVEGTQVQRQALARFNAFLAEPVVQRTLATVAVSLAAEDPTQPLTERDSEAIESFNFNIGRFVTRGLRMAAVAIGTVSSVAFCVASVGVGCAVLAALGGSVLLAQEVEGLFKDLRGETSTAKIASVNCDVHGRCLAEAVARSPYAKANHSSNGFSLYLRYDVRSPWCPCGTNLPIYTQTWTYLGYVAEQNVWRVTQQTHVDPGFSPSNRCHTLVETFLIVWWQNGSDLYASTDYGTYAKPFEPC